MRKKLSLLVQDNTWAIWDNTTHVKVSRPQKTCTALKSTIWNTAYIYMCRQLAPLVKQHQILLRLCGSQSVYKSYKCAVG